MERLNDYTQLTPLLPLIKTESIYPFSILEGMQSGEIFVDHMDQPCCALLWHYCGFANIIGHYNQQFLDDTFELMKNPVAGHSGRMVIQGEYAPGLEAGLLNKNGISRYERYIFRFDPASLIPLSASDAEIQPITETNYHLISGRIIPAFSWDSKESFLKNGFGFCAVQNEQVMSCAFSSAVTRSHVDIGVETMEEARGKGYGKAVVLAMIQEALNRGKQPVWGCDVRNEGSKALACSVGFNIAGTHSFYILG